MTLMCERNVDERLVTLSILKGRSFRQSIVRVYIVVEKYFFQVVPTGVIYDPGPPERGVSIRVNSKDDFNVMLLSVIENLCERIKIKSDVTVYGRKE